MTGVQKVLETDKIINPYSWNTLLLRDGVYYSVNHYPAGKTYDDGKWKPERAEFRYSLDRKDEFEQLGHDPAKLGVEFDDRDYRVGFWS